MGEVIYQYDGSLEGFLCCVYECYAYKEQPVSFCCEDDPLSLYEVRTVITREDRSRRVRLGISGRSEKAMTLVRRGFLTCMEDKELRLLALIQKLMAEGSGFLRDLSDPACYPVYRAIRHMNGELEKLRGFVRFSDYGGVLGRRSNRRTGCCRCCGDTFLGGTGTRSFLSMTAHIGSCCSTRRGSRGS